MIKLLSLFSGIGAFEKALTNLNIEYELVNYCEIDKHASKAFCLIHDEDESKNLCDITKVNEKELPDFDLMTYGFPCQSFSLAGKRLGLKDPVKGNLFFESMRLANEKKPKYMIAENVKGLLSDDNGQTFQTIIATLDCMGYNNYFQVLNAKDYGIPQNRERIFIISIRKDIDDLSFEFPKGKQTELRIKDFIDLKTKEREIPLNILNDMKNGNYEATKRIYKINEMCPTLTTMDGGWTKPKVNVLHCVRELTSKECLLFTGFSEKDFNKLNKISNRQKYKMAGNSIVVNVLEEIFNQLFLSNKQKKWLF